MHPLYDDFTTPTYDGRYNLFGNRNNDERWVANTWNESRPGSFRGGRSTSANFTFSFPRKHWRTEETTDTSLRLRCEAHGETIRLGLLADFQEAAWPTTWAGAHRAT